MSEWEDFFQRANRSLDPDALKQLYDGLSNLYTELADAVNAGLESVDPKHVLAKVESLVELADWERERT